MSGAEILSLIGIIIGLAVLVVLVMKGINIYVVAFIASIIVAVFGRMNLYEALKTDYMASFASFVQNYWLIFLTGALMGKIYEITNGAKSIARVIVKLFDSAGLRYSCLWWCQRLRCIICGFPDCT